MSCPPHISAALNTFAGGVEVYSVGQLQEIGPQGLLIFARSLQLNTSRAFLVFTQGSLPLQHVKNKRNFHFRKRQKI